MDTTKSKGNLLFYLLGLSVGLVNGQNFSVKDCLLQLNEDNNIEMNIFINPRQDEEIGLNNDLPKLIITDITVTPTSVHEYATGNCLTVAYINPTNTDEVLSYMDKLLWKLHLTNILLVWEGPISYPHLQWTTEIFAKCWRKGFVNVLLWLNGQLVTYNPYPEVRPFRLKDLKSYRNKDYLYNFHEHSWNLPFVEYSPRCYSYRNRRGQLVRTGYMYKIIALFFGHYNGSLRSIEYDMWTQNNQLEDTKTRLIKMSLDVAASVLYPDDFYLASDTLWLSCNYLMVPTSQEIGKQLYLLKPFSLWVWLILLVIFVVLFMGIFTIKRLVYNDTDAGLTFLQALAIFWCLSCETSKRQPRLNAFMCFMTLAAGLLLTNYYNCNLSSMMAAKIYEPELKEISDIARTQLEIYEHSVDVPYYRNRGLPSLVLDRLRSYNNSYFKANRSNLNTHLYIYGVFDDVGRWLMMQQLYLKKPRARMLEETTYRRPLTFALRNRSPVWHQFNRYLLYLKESGLVYKLMDDNQWDGILSGELKFFRDPEENKSLTMQFFVYGFVLWICGLVVASICFLIEKKLDYMKTIVK